MLVGHVIKIEPVLSDDESDQGVGSECDDVKEDFERPQTTSSSGNVFEYLTPLSFVLNIFCKIKVSAPNKEFLKNLFEMFC